MINAAGHFLDRNGFATITADEVLEVWKTKLDSENLKKTLLYGGLMISLVCGYRMELLEDPRLIEPLLRDQRISHAT